MRNIASIKGGETAGPSWETWQRREPLVLCLPVGVCSSIDASAFKDAAERNRKKLKFKS